MTDKISYGGLKARDVADHVRTMGFEKGVFHCIVKLAEYQTVIRESQMEMAQLLDKVIDLTGDFSTIAANMKNAVTELQKKETGVSDDEISN